MCQQPRAAHALRSTKISKAFPNSSVLSVPANKDSNFQDRGRPKGGLSIILPKMLGKSIELIKSDYWRIQQILLTKYLIINTYFPTDSKKPNEDCEELQTCLGHIWELLRKMHYFKNCIIFIKCTNPKICIIVIDLQS